MCGIAGFSGRNGLSRDQATIATMKMKILGLFNQSRGSHGCGLYVNGEIFKGIEDIVAKKNTKLFDKFISDPKFEWPALDLDKGNIIIAHTRQATYGTHTPANTHPFKIESEDPDKAIIGVHNGTIDNIWTLCADHGLNSMDYDVDSHALYALISKVGLNVLTEYQGAAALLFNKPSDLKTMYVYHGMSRKERHDKNVYGERPMHFMYTEEGIFFSSMPESLYAIRDDKWQMVEELKHNIVFQVTDGEFTDLQVPIDREEANIKPEVFPVRQWPVQQGGPRQNHYGNNRHNKYKNFHTLVEEGYPSKNKRRLEKTPDENMVWRELKTVKALAARDSEVIYFWKGRYHRSAGDKLASGLIYIAGRGIICEETTSGAIPHWFYHGVMLKNQTAYEALVNEANLVGSWVHKSDSNYAYDISRYAKHPVTYLESEGLETEDYFRFSWYLNEKRVTEKFRPDFSGRCYVIEDGFLTEIKGSNKDDKNTLSQRNIVAAPCCTTSDNMELPETSVFDIVFDKMKTVMETLNYKDVVAMACFVEDSLEEEGRAPEAGTHYDEMWKLVRTGVAAGRTIREALDDTTNTLETYLQIIEDQEAESGVPIRDQVNSVAPQVVDSIDAMINAYDETEKAAEGYYNSNQSAMEIDEYAPFVYEEETDEPLVDGADRRIEEDIDAAFRKYEEGMLLIAQRKDELAIKKVDDCIELFQELGNAADDLQSNDEDFAQEACYRIYQGLGLMRASLAEVCGNYYQKELVNKIRKQLVS